MTPEITELIKKKAEAYIKDSTIDEKFLTNSEYDSIISDYSAGQIETIEMIPNLLKWWDNNAVRNGEDEWTTGSGKETEHFTTIELLTKYIKEVQPFT